MKLTNEDLRRIILEEIQAVLKEGILQPDNIENETSTEQEKEDEKVTHQSAGLDLKSLGKEFQNNSEFRKQMTPAELEKWLAITKKTLEMATDPDKKNNAIELERVLNRIKTDQR